MDALEDRSWAEGATLVYIYSVPRMIKKLESICIEILKTMPKNARILTYENHFEGEMTQFLVSENTTYGIKLYM